MSEDDTAVVNESVENTTDTESTTVEQKEFEDALESKVFGGEQDEESEDKTEDEESEDKEHEQEADEKPKKGAEARKEQLSHEINNQNEEIRQLVAEKNRLSEEKARLEQEFAQVEKAKQIPTVEELLNITNDLTGDYYTEFEATAIVENLKLRQQLEEVEQRRADDERTRAMATATSQFASELSRTLVDFPELDSKSDKYDEALARVVLRSVEQSMVTDPVTGNPVTTREPVYDLAKDIVELRKPVRNTRLYDEANADVIGGRGGSNSKSEEQSFIDDFFKK